MRGLLYGVGKAALQGAVELLLYFPVAVLIDVFLFGGARLWLWLPTMVAAYALGYLYRVYFPNSKFVSVLLVFTLFAAIHAWLLFGISLQSLGILAISWVSAFRGSRFAVYVFRYAFPSMYYTLGLFVYFIVSIVSQAVAGLHDYTLFINGFGIAALVVSIIMFNQNMLKQETLEGHKEPVLAKSMLWKNRLLIGVMIVGIAFVAAFEFIRDAVIGFMQMIVAFIVSLLSWSNEEEIEEIVDLPPQQEPPMFDTSGEPSMFWIILERIMKVVFVIILIAVVIFFIYWIVKNGAKWMKRFYAWLSNRFQFGESLANVQGYEEDVERVASWKDLRDQWKDRLLGFMSREKRIRWKDLRTNQERIRYLYREELQSAIEGGYLYKPHLTPAETKRDMEKWAGREELQKPMIESYERARYSDNPVSDEEVELVRKQQKQGKKGQK